MVCDIRFLKSPGTSMVGGVYGLWGELIWANGFMIMIAKVPWVIPDNSPKSASVKKNGRHFT